jgi:hypothetical protein
VTTLVIYELIVFGVLWVELAKVSAFAFSPFGIAANSACGNVIGRPLEG